MSGNNTEKKARKPYATAEHVKAAFFDFKKALSGLGIDSSNISMTRDLDGNYIINGFAPEGLTTQFATTGQAVEKLRQYTTIIQIMADLHTKPTIAQVADEAPLPTQKRRMSASK